MSNDESTSRSAAVSSGTPFERPAKEDRKSRVTIKDIAKVAGVHFTTVSLALRNHPSIPPTTRNKIRAVADRLDYVPNPVFSALTHFHLNGRVRAEPPRIAYLVNQPLETGPVLYRHHDAFFEGARQQARVLGYEVDLIFVGKGRHDSASLEAYLKKERLNGVVIAAFEPGGDTISLNWNDYTVVKINSLHHEPLAPMVANDQRQDVRLAFQRMLTLGYKRIGLAVGKGDEEGTEYRYSAGYLIEQSSVPVADRVPQLLFPHQATRAVVSKLMGEWVRQHKIEAVLCNWSITDELLSEAGFRVPDDVACACLCLLDKNKHLAGVYPNLHMVGAKAISLVTTMLKSGDRDVPEFASRTYVRSYWQDGETAPPKH
jgi:LacI family transcriptional regulator